MLPPLRRRRGTAATDDADADDAFSPPLSNVTLREYLSHPDGFHLGMGPAFFGFYAYFGALAAMNEEVRPPREEGGGREADGGADGEGSSSSSRSSSSSPPPPPPPPLPVLLPTDANLARAGPGGARVLLRSVAGASAGAMAAVFLAAGADPWETAQRCTELAMGEVADFPALGAVLVGDQFERILRDGLERWGGGGGGGSARFEDAVLPVAVSGFDLLTMSGQLLTEGCMARAARASATFPGLFQPVSWRDGTGGGRKGTDGGERDGTGTGAGTGGLLASLLPDRLLVDGGIADRFGLAGLAAASASASAAEAEAEGDGLPRRIVNLNVGTTPSPPGPSDMPPGVRATEVASISIENLPRPAPWAMEEGPRAVEAARRAVAAVLDVPMHLGREPGHYELCIDAAAFS